MIWNDRYVIFWYHGEPISKVDCQIVDSAIDRCEQVKGSSADCRIAFPENTTSRIRLSYSAEIITSA